ncbi:unnamed protein product [Moneuplotes crassus]|uniref:AMP-dependent synthetase/ligase domain-containing protein n=1 Tax=Euplotes crassus TaxID=5936 RepID=A0AAD1TYQ1_EUPCR|nr:unnamed protein product [Moneuplotes crassus]
MKANDNEYVILSVKGYKKLAGIDNTGKNLYWTTDINTEIPIKMKLQKQDGYEPLMPKTLSEYLIHNVENYPEDPCLHAELMKGTWTTWNWAQVFDISFRFAKALVAIHATHRSSVNIIGFNSPYWMFAFFGTIMADNIAVGVYTTNEPGACQYVAEHSSAEVVVAEDEKQMQKYISVLDQLPKLKRIIVWNTDRFIKRPHPLAIGWEEFLDLANDQTESDLTNEEIVKERIKNQVPGMCCNIVYTSGTTGNPKGVMLTHDNQQFVIIQMIKNAEDEGFESGKERVVSYLPLSHSAAQANDVLGTIVFRNQVYFARPDALQGSLVETMQYAKPTIFLAVPRVYEKMEEKLKEIASQAPGVLQRLSNWAKTKGAAHTEARLQGKPNPFGYSLAHFLVLGRIKKALGLEEAKVLIVGAAPLKKATFDYFKSLDMPIVNSYGMSECNGPETVSKVKKYKEDTVGFAIPETHIKIESREQTEGGYENEGEICFRGRNNFIGYLNNEEKTKETLDQDGYIHSGDIGTKDEEGFVKITGRIKELIVTAGGENVAPVLIEDSLKDICPIISNVMVIGDDKKFLSALITLKVEVDNSEGLNTPTKDLTPNVKTFLSKELNIKGVTTTDDAIDNEDIQRYIQEKIDENNKISISRAQYIRKYRILPTDFSIEGGELTPTLKLKRNIAIEKYKDIIEEMYTEEEPQKAKI